MQVTAWLIQQGYKNVFNVKGGIDAYAKQVDSSVGFY
jgi:predicted sulfurtransferase